MRVMTFNLRFDNAEDGARQWPHRRSAVVDLIRKYRPVILGTQEGMQRPLLFLREELPGYRMHAPGRVWDTTCQYATLFILQDELEILDGGEFWLSKTPGLHRSKDWKSGFPRLMSFALLRQKNGDAPFYVVVTHLDHIGKDARQRQAAMIAEWIRERPEPTIVLGDFNDVPGSSVHTTLVSPETGLRDTWQDLGFEEDENSTTHHDFEGNPNNGRLDWVLIPDPFRVETAEIIRDNEDGRYPSDHFPYLVDLSRG